MESGKVFETFDEFVKRKDREQLDESVKDIIKQIEKKVGELDQETQAWLIDQLKDLDLSPSKTEIINRMINMLIHQIV